MKLIELHKQMMETGVLPDFETGLCGLLYKTKYEEYLTLFEPTDEERIDLSDNGELKVFWASGLLHQYEYRGDGNGSTLYTPRRQSIVLLICAMCGEI